MTIGRSSLHISFYHAPTAGEVEARLRRAKIVVRPRKETSDDAGWRSGKLSTMTKAQMGEALDALYRMALIAPLPAADDPGAPQTAPHRVQGTLSLRSRR